MKKNIGTIDRLVRIFAGIIILGLGLYFKSFLGLIGLLPLLTGLTSRCGAYVPLNIDTTEKKE